MGILLATYIGKERVGRWYKGVEPFAFMLMANKEYNIFIEEYSDYIETLVFNKKGTKLRVIIKYENYSSLRKEWKLAEKNDALISQCLTTFS